MLGVNVQPIIIHAMKPIRGTGILLAALLVSVISVGILAGSYVSAVREYRRIQSELAVAEQNRGRLRVLVSECLEYRKHNPAIEPLLQSFNLLRSTNAHPTVKPLIVP